MHARSGAACAWGKGVCGGKCIPAACCRVGWFNGKVGRFWVGMHKALSIIARALPAMPSHGLVLSTIVTTQVMLQG
eukprot:12422802-Karenia_brevis.AAC.1